MQTIGRYQLRQELGRGGMGVVYRAYDPELDREVALKSVMLEGITPEQRVANEQYLSREARAAARLQHPHAVAIYDFFSSGDRAFIVMEFVRGASLEALLATGDTSNHGLTLQVLREAASALDAAHLAGIIHRDVKPGNILLDETGHVKIADFGIARLTTGNVTQTSPSVGTTAGTLSYMSPEQVRGDKLDGRSDQFALAVLAFQLFTGQLPFQAETWIAQSYKILNEAPIPLQSLNPNLPPSVAMAIGVALQKDPMQRFPTCKAFVDALAGTVVAHEEKKSKFDNRWLLIPIFVLATGFTLMIIRQAIRTMETPAPQPSAAPAVAATTPANPVVAPAPSTLPPPPQEESLALILDGIPMDFAKIPAGQYVMGCDSCDMAEKPEHRVDITKPFQLGRTEVTEKHWNAVMTGKASGTNKPKVNISWNDAQAFLAKLNARGDGFHYRLPTEAEWEYCARAGDRGLGPRNIDDYAWTSNNASGELQEVASAKLSNLWGLYDMLGNASEWTSDWMAMDYYQHSPQKDPQGPASGKMRMFRGGHAGMGAAVAFYYNRSADEPSAKGPYLGMRVVRQRK
jgi:serine/threonine protein kinase